MQGNIPKPLRNLYIKFDVNTLRHCGEIACVEHLPTFGNSDITTISIEFYGNWQKVTTHRYLLYLRFELYGLYELSYKIGVTMAT